MAAICYATGRHGLTAMTSRFPLLKVQGREAFMTKFSNSFVHNLIETLVRPMGTECLAECRRHGRLTFGDALPGLAAGILSSEYFFRRYGPGRRRNVAKPLSCLAGIGQADRDEKNRDALLDHFRKHPPGGNIVAFRLNS